MGRETKNLQTIKELLELKKWAQHYLPNGTNWSLKMQSWMLDILEEELFEETEALYLKLYLLMEKR